MPSSRLTADYENQTKGFSKLYDTIRDQLLRFLGSISEDIREIQFSTISLMNYPKLLKKSITRALLLITLTCISSKNVVKFLGKYSFRIAYEIFGERLHARRASVGVCWPQNWREIVSFSQVSRVLRKQSGMSGRRDVAQTDRSLNS